VPIPAPSQVDLAAVEQLARNKTDVSNKKYFILIFTLFDLRNAYVVPVFLKMIRL